MSEPVDLLLITHNRREYVQKTIASLFQDPARFRIYWWDNGSTDGTIDVVRSSSDGRLVESYLSRDNVNQGIPTRWFLDTSRSDVVGKIDDDILLPSGWTERIAPIIRSDDTFGMLACWTFMPDDWNEPVAIRNVITHRGHRIFRMLTVAGCSFLARKQLLKQFQVADRVSLPVDRVAMSLAGFVSGCPLPLALAHHMDDPRSPHCLMRNPAFPDSQLSFTMRRLGFTSLEQYASWIAADARHYQVRPFAQQLRVARLRRDRSFLGRLKFRLLTTVGSLRLPPKPSI